MAHTLYHREQKNKPENATCSRCFTKGHLASSCRTCRHPSHKSGYSSCSKGTTESSSSSTLVEQPQTLGTSPPAPDSGDIDPVEGKTTAATTTTTTTTVTLRLAVVADDSQHSRLSGSRADFSLCPVRNAHAASPTQQPDSAKAARTGG